MFELVNITQTILREIENTKMKQAQVALTYSLAIKSKEAINWTAINQAIINRWSESGLERIKAMAWKLVNVEVER